MKEWKYTKKYSIDFPNSGYFNWKTVRIKKKTHYYDGTKTVGVLLHDGRFVAFGIMFNKNEFEVIDENPLDLPDEELVRIYNRINKI